MQKYKHRKGLGMNELLSQLLWQSMAKDERVTQILQEVQNSGMSAEELFYKKAKEQGVDPNSILTLLNK